ncbi:MOSC N-terminal beta barrel domain-containing protein [Skermania piniformis]
MVEPWGLRDDRRWALVDRDGRAVTARTHQTLLLVSARCTATGITASAAGRDDLTVPFPTGPVEPVRHFRKTMMTVPAGRSADTWFTELLDEPVRLMYQADPRTRPVDPEFGRPDDRVSLADGYPLLLASTSSLAALNAWIATGPYAAEGPMDMRRFRPNLVVDGAPAWAEDDWRRIRIGAAEFRVVKGCNRCVLTTVDPDTAARGREPLVTLAQHRQWDRSVWFASNLIPDNPGVRLTVGDELTVLESAARRRPVDAADQDN